jgi:hypothetical protein
MPLQLNQFLRWTNRCNIRTEHLLMRRFEQKMTCNVESKGFLTLTSKISRRVLASGTQCRRVHWKYYTSPSSSGLKSKPCQETSMKQAASKARGLQKRELYIEAGGSLEANPSIPTGSSEQQRKPIADSIVVTRRHIPEARTLNLTK